ncbi:MAG: adenosyl-hopene transferase HpnH [Bryobacteraceae bacterium]|nr:adenosyl-hopene transferase HpnH [Bryobacteraceae bacterium]MDW8377695.1 adenosyl-hopene transferase HpnH [Bryobacterales bacterium]
MPVPLSQMWTVATYVLKQKWKGRRQYPLVLMLEPLYRCNLACAGCGKIQYPGHILKRELSPEECFRAVEECGAPVVAIPGGEPLLHSRIEEIVAGLVARRKYVYLCTNALLLKQKLHLFKPSKYLSFSVHMDGPKEQHDFSVCKEGGYELAVEGIRAAVAKGFRVTTNTTLFEGADARSVRAFFDEMMELGVEGMMLSPGYSYEKAPDQQHFLAKDRIRQLFRLILSNRKPHWRFNMSPLYLEFLMGLRQTHCTPWGMPTYTIFGWQKPCYLMQDGYADTFEELLASTRWEKYGTNSGNPKCANCMVHSGYEASTVDYAFGSWRGFWDMVKATLFHRYPDAAAQKALETEKPAPKLVQIDLSKTTRESLEGIRFAGATVAEGIEKAFDYRGDLTLRLKNGQQLEGYVFDRDGDGSSSQGRLRMILKTTGERVSVPYADLEELCFTGRDMAAGKSWEAWVAKYLAKKAAGEPSAELVAETLDS